MWVPSRRVLVRSACLLAGAAPLPATLDGALDHAREATGTPAATGAVMRCGSLLWSGASGVRDLKSRTPATPDTPFAVASTTKTVTAALVLDLVQRRRLTLATRLSRFYPKLPAASRITVRMLLDHTSGLNDYFDDARINRTITNSPRHHWTRAEVLRAVTKTNFRPGTRYEYSNSNYVVLGGIVEKLSHTPIETAFRARVARPSGLTSSTFTYRPARSGVFAHPYLGFPGSFSDGFVAGYGLPSDYWGPVWTDGGLASTSPDLARFGDALFEGRLLSAATLRTMTALNRFHHALGLDPVRYGGHAWLGHNGGYAGYGAEIWHDAGRRLTVTTLTSSSRSSTAVWQELVSALGPVLPSSPACG